MVIQIQVNHCGQIRLNVDPSEPIPITNGVKQGCVLAPVLFIIFFSIKLKQETDDMDDEDGGACQVPSGWRPLQSTEPPKLHYDPGEANHGPSLRG